jgi:hypothetical protein
VKQEGKGAAEGAGRGRQQQWQQQGLWRVLCAPRNTGARSWAFEHGKSRVRRGPSSELGEVFSGRTPPLAQPRERKIFSFSHPPETAPVGFCFGLGSRAQEVLPSHSPLFCVQPTVQLSTQKFFKMPRDDSKKDGTVTVNIEEFTKTRDSVGFHFFSSFPLGASRRASL